MVLSYKNQAKESIAFILTLTIGLFSLWFGLFIYIEKLVILNPYASTDIYRVFHYSVSFFLLISLILLFLKGITFITDSKINFDKIKQLDNNLSKFLFLGWPFVILFPLIFAIFSLFVLESYIIIFIFILMGLPYVYLSIFKKSINFKTNDIVFILNFKIISIVIISLMVHLMFLMPLFFGDFNTSFDKEFYNDDDQMMFSISNSAWLIDHTSLKSISYNTNILYETNYSDFVYSKNKHKLINIKIPLEKYYSNISDLNCISIKYYPLGSFMNIFIK